MAKFCGGIKLDPKYFKIIDGVICDKWTTEEDLDVTNTISACGQLWDGNIFTSWNGVITSAKIYFEHPPVPIKGNCGIGLDGLYFKLDNGVVSPVGEEGFLLDVNVAPSDATIKVIDVNGDKWDPIAGTTNIFILTKVGTYRVEVSKTGYITKDEYVRIDADHVEQTIEVTLEAAG